MHAIERTSSFGPDREFDALIKAPVSAHEHSSMRQVEDERGLRVRLLIGGSMIMIESEWPEVANRAPAADGSSPVVLYVYVEDVDRMVERAVAAGARIVMPLTNQFWGDRTAWIVDPSGHVWTLAMRIEESLSPRRFRELFGSEVGFSPKTFCRIRRFNEVLRRIERLTDVDWADVALFCGYFDQADLKHDFRVFAGLTPSAYPRYRMLRTHVVVSGA